jgi:hypothetical protein
MNELNKENKSVTAYISSRDRYFTTLPTAIYSIIQQTVKPEKFILFMDGEHLDLREHEIYHGIFRLLEFYSIQWEVVFSPQRGSVINHNHAIEMAKTKWLLRIDDDNFLESTVLEKLLSCDGEKVGAVAGLVIDPKTISYLPPDVTPTLEGIGRNVQWYFHHSKDLIEAEHLYSSFIFKKEAGHGCCCLDLSPASHREESIFSHEMYRRGWKLLVNPQALTWHFRQPKNGIRTFENSPQFWAFDEKVFQFKLKEWGYEEPKLIYLDNGKGDHIMFKTILPLLKEQFKQKRIIISACYRELFEDEKDVEIVSLDKGKDLCALFNKNLDDFNIYKFCTDKNWTGHLIEAFMEMYRVTAPQKLSHDSIQEIKKPTQLTGFSGRSFKEKK